MKLSRDTACQMFEIWQPLWSKRMVYLACHKVGTHNKIVFTKAPTMPGEYYVSGRDVHMCDKTTNGKIEVYSVPLSFLEPLERVEPTSAKQLKIGF